MSSSTSITSRRRCNCGAPSPLRTSTTEANFGKKFFGCARYGSGKTCDFFTWYKPEEQIADLECENRDLKEKLSRNEDRINRLEQKFEVELERKVMCKVEGDILREKALEMEKKANLYFYLLVIIFLVFIVHVLFG
ncbi:hypothetical protein ACHQM5_008326 [Ranunculus cassubicifolius]